GFQNFQAGSQAGSGPQSALSSGAATPSAGASSVSVASLTAALQKLGGDTPISEHLSEVQRAQKPSDVKKQAEQIAQKILQAPSAGVVEEWRLLEVLKSLAKPKNTALIRESAPLIVQQLALQMAGQTPKEAHLVQFFGAVFDLFTDKDKNVLRTAKHTVDVMYGVFPVE
ncbi:hypothetical protein OXX59_010195, partial [Metschnikowia pulcherrima]